MSKNFNLIFSSTCFLSQAINRNMKYEYENHKEQKKKKKKTEKLQKKMTFLREKSL